MLANNLLILSMAALEGGVIFFGGSGVLEIALSFRLG